MNKAHSDVTDSLREVRYEYSNNLAELLDRLQISLFFSTYQAGKLGVITVRERNLSSTYHNNGRASRI